VENPKISIIIPIVNEEKVINKLIHYLRPDSSVEIIFVDGGSQDKTVNIIQESGFKVIISPVTQRSYQMNLGAKEATGEVLLFLHGDTLLPKNFVAIILQTIQQKDFVAGAFRLKIDSEQIIFRGLEILVKWRSQLFSLPYGDQAIFLTKKEFEQVNGFDNLAIMEDFALMKKLQSQGKIYLTEEAVTTSARRWQKLGVIKTTMINQLMIIGYYLGIENQKLANIYRQVKKKI
jgi:rSAM/selenodomain-associated transferase 2